MAMQKGEGLGGERNPNYSHGARVGGVVTPEYNSWYGMIQRCTNPKRRYYHRYGGRGITVCDRWRSFGAFLEDMGAKPSPGHSLDRIDNDGNYEPNNCKWSTQKEQLSNSTNITWLEVDGRNEPVSFWSDKVGLPVYVIMKRIRRGWTPHDAVYIKLKKPTDARKKRV